MIHAPDASTSTEGLVLLLTTDDQINGAHAAALHAAAHLDQMIEAAEENDNAEAVEGSEQDLALVDAFAVALHQDFKASLLRSLQVAEATARVAHRDVVAAQTAYLRSQIIENFPEVVSIQFSASYVDGSVIASIDHAKQANGEDVNADVFVELQMLTAEYPQSYEDWYSGNDGLWLVRP